jgi:hypothetical protein
MSNQLRSLLQKPQVRDTFCDAVTTYWNGPQRAALASNEHVLDSVHKKHFLGVIKSHSLTSIADLWRKDVSPHLPRPLVITGHDFTSAAEALFLVEPVSFDEAYASFVGYLAASAMIQRTRPPVRAFVGFFGHGGETEQEILWSTAAGFAVRLAGFIPVEDEHAPDHDHGDNFPVSLTARRAVYFRFEGRCSTRAFGLFQRQACRVLRYASRSYLLIKRLDSSIAPRFGGVIEFGQHLAAYFSTPSKKDSIDRRLRNALHLGVQSENQRHNALGLALSVAVIESLLCLKGDSIANMFAENGAALLEPDPTYRSAAVEFLKKLYDARSKVLHGDVLEHEPIKRLHARTIAGAVIQALFERRDFLRRAEDKTETPDEFIKELRDGKWVAGQLTGVAESPVRTLWGAPFQGDPPETESDE